VLTPTEVGFSWPWPTLTKETFGIHRKFLYALGAGTGVGKTDVFTQCVAHTIMGSPERNEPGRPAATFFLEQPPAETVKRIAGKVFGKRFHVPDGGWTDEDLSAAVDALESEGLLYIYNHFGSIDWDVIKSRMRFVAIQYGVKDIFLDHLTALAAHASDEKKAIEEIMAELAGMAHELDLTIYFISHLATPDGKPHEEGGRVMIRHFKGSRAIGYWSYFMFGLERDQQAEDEKDRQTTTFRILKDRLTGQSTGKTFLLGYDPETGILYEKQPEDDCDFEDETVNEDDDVPF
jgi:twinkle protein